MEINESLAKQIQARTREFQKKRLWKKSTAIAKTFGRKDVREASDHTTVTYDFNQNRCCGFFRVYLSNFVYGGYYVNVEIAGKTVLSAQETFADSEDAKHFPFQICKYGSSLLFVKIYIPGDWEKLMDMKFMRKEVKALEAAEQGRLKEHDETAEKSRPLTREEQELAANFGIKG
ncbi:MAG: hypothetical protein NTZ49_00245 [Candidatus Parcubacteria bacterium]|nr:hypothetical protein [Candidatus Parcubacteria bacterium]